MANLTHAHVVTDITAAIHETTSNDIPIQIPPVLPLYGRRGLERLQQDGVDYFYAGGGYVAEGYLDAADRARSRRGRAPFAPELEVDPDAGIDADRASSRYLRSLSPSYKRGVDQLVHSLDDQPKADKPKAVITIPAAAHQEGRNIYRTLEQYAMQREVSPDDFEVVVFANYPRGARRDSTISEVRRFQKEHPEIHVRLLEKRLERQEANIGRIRKLVTDTVITDLLARDVPLDDVVLVSNDADSEWIDPRYLRTVLDQSETNPNVDAFLGAIDWGYDAYTAHTQMLAATRLMQMIDIYSRVAKHEVGSSGANFVFRPGMYAAVGGYQTNATFGEDVLLGRMIKGVRSGANTRRPIGFLGRSSTVNTSARRALETLFNSGGAPATQWDGEFGAEDSLRTRQFDLQDFDFSDPEKVEGMVQSAQRMFNQTLSVYRPSLVSSPRSSYRQGRLTMYDTEVIRQLNRMFSVIGADIEWQPDGSVKIVDSDRMVHNLQKWQAKH